jgi:hypothetical protein
MEATTLSAWAFDSGGPSRGGIRGPVLLASRGMALPPSPGLYLVTSGGCLSHVGTSGKIANRVRTLANLGTHRGSAEALGAAYCTGEGPLVWWEELPNAIAAREREREFKQHFGEPPQPRSEFGQCTNGAELLKQIVMAAGPDTWEAGFAEAVFRIGEKLSLLFEPRFADLWERVGTPPGPWRSRATRG